MLNRLRISQPLVTWPSGDTASIATFIEICLYEDINKAFMSGYITTYDAGELSALIVGGETLTFEIESPLEEGDVTKEFVIYAKDNEQIDERGVRILKLMFTSAEALLAQSKRVCKRWNTKVSGILQNIFEEMPITTGKTIEVDPSAADYDYIAPNISCDQIIKDLLPLCYDDEGYPFVVFENTRGFHIKSIKTLLDGYNPDAEFKNTNSLTKTQRNRLNPSERSLFLERCQIYRNNDLMHILNRSAVSSAAMSFDMYTRTAEMHSFSINDKNPYDGSKSFKQFDDTFLSKHAAQDRGQITLDVAGAVPFYADHAQKRGFRRSMSTLTAAVRVEFEQTHDVLLHRVGECVNLTFDTQLDTTDPERKRTTAGQRLAGRYLITKVAHIFRQGQVDLGTEIVEAMKLGYGEAV